MIDTNDIVRILGYATPSVKFTQESLCACLANLVQSQYAWIVALLYRSESVLGAILLCDTMIIVTGDARPSTAIMSHQSSGP